MVMPARPRTVTQGTPQVHQVLPAVQFVHPGSGTTATGCVLTKGGIFVQLPLLPFPDY